MDDARPMIHIRLPKNLIKQVDHVAVDWDKDRAKTIEQLLAAALEHLDGRDQIRALDRVAVGSR